MKSINLNDIIYVELTPFGVEVYNNHYRQFHTKPDMLSRKSEDKYTKFQIHEFMNIFGKYLYAGAMYQVIKFNNIHIKDETLKEVESS